MTAMHYTIRHVTRFTYETAISESVMEARMQPRSDGAQHCLRFGLSTTPAANVRMYEDHEGNTVHHFNVPGRHARLTVSADALVELAEPPVLPDRLDADAWDRLDARRASGEFWDWLSPSRFTPPTPLLNSLAAEIRLTRGDDPLTTLCALTGDLYLRFEYRPRSTRVDSPIDEALQARAGVCQDFAHIMIVLVRQLGVPCRYVSGYLFHEANDGLRSTDGATHAWVEAWMPGIGWTGFDPTNNMQAGTHHIRVAVGRDYADVPPTRGVFKGSSAVRSELAVSVRVGSAGSGPGRSAPAQTWVSREASSALPDTASSHQQQQ